MARRNKPGDSDTAENGTETDTTDFADNDNNSDNSNSNTEGQEATEMTTTEAEGTLSTEATFSDTTSNATVSADTTSASEAPVEASDTPSDDGRSTDTSDGTDSTKKSEPVDTSAFEAAVTAAFAEKDPSTGAVPEAFVQKVSEEYRTLEGLRGKNAAKKYIQNLLEEAVHSLDMTSARAYLTLQDTIKALVATSPTRAAATAAPVNPVESAATSVAILRLALDNVVLPDSIEQAELDAKVNEIILNTQEEVKAYITWMSTEPPVTVSEDGTETEGEKPAEPTVSVVAKNAAKLALGRSAKAGTPRAAAASGGVAARSPFLGKRGDIAKHITEAFADKPSGAFMSISEIAAFPSTEYRDSDGNPRRPSQGAISARLFPGGDGSKTSVEGIVGAEVDGKKGARKL